MAYLIDTSTLVEVLRAAPSQHLVRRLSQVPSRERLTSAITISQLLLAARQERDPKLMQDVVRLVSSIRVASYDLAAAQTFAKFSARGVGDCATDDVMIAAIAAANDYTLVTRRPHVFGAFGQLRLEDWTHG